MLYYFAFFLSISRLVHVENKFFIIHEIRNARLINIYYPIHQYHGLQIKLFTEQFCLEGMTHMDIRIQSH